jgi:hypothetical protein
MRSELGMACELAERINGNLVDIPYLGAILFISSKSPVSLQAQIRSVRLVQMVSRRLAATPIATTSK